MKFFVLYNPKVANSDAVTDYVAADGSRTGDAPCCPICNKFLGMLPLIPPVRVELEAWGTRWGDVAFGPGDQILVSSKLKRLAIEKGLAGFLRFDPIEILKANQHRVIAGAPPTYELASIHLSRAAIDEASSGLVRDETQACRECRIGGVIKRICKIVVEPNTWSAEDIFFARGLPGTILVSERVKCVFESHNLANCIFVAAEAFSFDHYPSDRGQIRIN